MSPFKRLSFTALIVIALLVAPLNRPQLAAREGWISVRSQNFLLIGNASEKQIRAVGTKLEQFRAVFNRIFAKGQLHTPVPTTVIVFADDESYRPFKAGENTAGYFQPGQEVNYITLTAQSRGEQDAFSVIFHEYTHLLIEKTVGNVPHWFNEGLAEYYSTFTLNNGREVVIGKPIARHLRLLRQGGLLPLRTLLEVNQKSPYYNEREKQGLFYAQSWLLVHYLLVANDGRRAPMLEKFIREIATNVPLERAFEDSFEMKIETLEQELLTYIKRNRFQVTTQVLDDRLDVTAPVAEAEMKEAEVQAYLGDLLLHCNRSDSEDYLQRALSLDANQPIANASLAMLRVRQGKFDEARENLERAVKANSENYLVHYYYAFALSREGVDETKRISGWAPGVEARMRAELNRAIELRPDFPESYNLLVFVNLVCGVQLDQSVKLLRQVLQTSPGRNDLLFMLAQVYIRKQDFNQAREILDLLSRSKNDADIAQQAESIRARLPSEAELASRRAVNDSLAAATESEGPSAAIDPVARLRDALRKPNSDETQIQGTLRRIECDSTGIVFDIQLEDRLLRLWSERLEAVRFISFYAGATGHVTCGTFKSEPSVIVCYVPGSKRFDGTPKSIEFVPHEFRLKS